MLNIVLQQLSCESEDSKVTSCFLQVIASSRIEMFWNRWGDIFSEECDNAFLYTPTGVKEDTAVPSHNFILFFYLWFRLVHCVWQFFLFLWKYLSLPRSTMELLLQSKRYFSNTCDAFCIKMNLFKHLNMVIWYHLISKMVILNQWPFFKCLPGSRLFSDSVKIRGLL